MSEHEKPSVDYVEEASLERKKEEPEVVVPVLTAEEEQRLWRKIDMRLMPILSLMYLMSFLDRGAYTHTHLLPLRSLMMLVTGNIGGHSVVPYTGMLNATDAETGNAKLQGLTDQLNLTGNKYNIALVCIVNTTASERVNARVQTMYFVVSLT
jgi:hypothetical protein